MNTFSYLSGLWSSPRSSQPPSKHEEADIDTDSLPPTPSTSTLPSQSETSSSSSSSTVFAGTSTTVATTTIDTDSESTSSEHNTLYLSARRPSRPGERPRITLSHTQPPHLASLTSPPPPYDRVVIPANPPPPPSSHNTSSSSSTTAPGVVRSETVSIPETPVTDNDGDDGEAPSIDQGEGDEEKKPLLFKKGEDQKGQASEFDEGERRLKLRREQEALNATRAWPVRLSVGLYILLRQFLSWFGLPLPPARKGVVTAPAHHSVPIITTPPTPTQDNSSFDDKDELLTALSPPSATAPPPTTSSRTSTFFLRRSPPSTQTPSATPPLSRSPSPSLPSSTLTTQGGPKQPPKLTPKTLVLDLDETLIHSTSRPYASSARNAGLKVRVVEVVLEGRSTVYTVYKRPWVDYFLRKVSAWYTVIIFTASLPEYADPVIDWLDGGDGGGGMVGGRLFRSDCRHSNGSYVKDLSVVDADLSRVCLVDNSPASYAINQANGIPIEGWINDPNDECLLDLLPMLDSLRFTSDVRRVLGLRGFAK
ncbi:NIF-domain-containing protein [Meredithblackwellia eburnea MCA 4105]